MTTTPRFPRSDWLDAVLDAHDLGGAGRKSVVCVAAALARHVNRDGSCFPGRRLLMRETGIGSEHTVADALDALAEGGYLETDWPGSGRARVFTLTFPTRAPLALVGDP